VYGSLTGVDAPEGPDRVWAYNSNNELTSETQPESGTTSYTYTAGLLATKTDAMSRVTTYHYDGNKRLIAIESPVPTENVTYSYDAADNRTRMVTAGLESIFTYDAAERLTARQDNINGKLFSTTYAYDDNDNLTQI
jgi:YD repeat-containing protein